MICPRLAIMFCAATFIAGSSAGQLISNRDLICSLPTDVESVMIFRAADLVKDGSPYRDDLKGFFDVGHAASTNGSGDLVSSVGESNLDRVIVAALMSSKPAVRMFAGWEFAKAPPDGQIGIAKFQHMQLWATEESLKPLADSVERRDKIIGDVSITKIGDTTVYSSELQMGRAKEDSRVVYFAFPMERVCVRSDSRPQLETFVRNLMTAKRPEEIPTRWAKAAAGVNLESPIVVLSKLAGPVGVLKCDSNTPGNIETKVIRLDSFAIAALSDTKMRFRVNCVSADAIDAQSFFYGSAFKAGFSPELWRWSSERDADGFKAELSFDAPGKRSFVDLSLLGMWGVAMAI